MYPQILWEVVADPKGSATSRNHCPRSYVIRHTHTHTHTHPVRRLWISDQPHVETRA